MNDNINTSNVDRTFMGRLELRRKEEFYERELAELLENISSSAELDSFVFDTLPADSKDELFYFELPYAEEILPYNNYGSIFSNEPHRPRPRLIHINMEPIASDKSKPVLEVIKNESLIGI
jgi:hypothetical protein